MPTVDYFLSTSGHSIDEEQPLWSRPLPERNALEDNGSRSGKRNAVTYGSYFSSIHRFCESDGWMWVVQAASDRLSQALTVNDLGTVSIFLEKHGAFYHPARLQVMIKNQPLSFVVNVAVSEDGRKTMPREVSALIRLNQERPFGWFPRVYHYDPTDLPMFSGDWFERFHEFHLTRTPASRELAMIAWDGSAPPKPLSTNQITSLYRQAAMILTACYDPITSYQIFPWHHAAGDFVVRIEKETATVKLITVRDYQPMTTTAPDEFENERALLDGLVLFFIHLTIRMRLDRIDGVGEVVWAPNDCLAPIIEGFFQGLDLAAGISGFPAAFPDGFRAYLGRHDSAMLSTLAHRVTAIVFKSNCETRGIIDTHLAEHITDIHRSLAI